MGNNPLLCNLMIPRFALGIVSRNLIDSSSRFIIFRTPDLFGRKWHVAKDKGTKTVGHVLLMPSFLKEFEVDYKNVCINNNIKKQ